MPDKEKFLDHASGEIIERLVTRYDTDTTMNHGFVEPFQDAEDLPDAPSVKFKTHTEGDLCYLDLDQLTMIEAWETEHYKPEPGWPAYRQLFLRLHLIGEELSELAQAFADRDPIKVLDALGDLDVVLTGTWMALGLQHFRKAVSSEILRSNLSKLDPVTGKVIKTAAGRVQKGPNYSPPDLKKVARDVHNRYPHVSRSFFGPVIDHVA